MSSWVVCVALYTKRDRRLVGLTERVRAGCVPATLFLANKYYLDDLYENVIVRGIAHPIAAAAYWINQNVIDGIVNGAGRGRPDGRRVVLPQHRPAGRRRRRRRCRAPWPPGPGSALRPVQSGRVNQYGALLFGAAAIGAVVLVIVNV